MSPARVPTQRLPRTEKEQKDTKSVLKEPLNPKTTTKEFGGIPGVAAITFGLPTLTAFLVFSCNEGGCPSLPTKLPQLRDVWSLEAFTIYAAWWLWCAFLHVVVPGPLVTGVELRNGKRLKYKINGFRCFIFSACVIAGLQFAGIIRLARIAELYTQLIGSATLFSTMMSIGLYISVTAWPKDRLLALGGNTGAWFYDWFIGKELNPRTVLPGGFEFDWKCFNELRPGLSSWILLVVGIAAQQYENTGNVTKELLMLLLMQAWYVMDSLLHEPAILTTMDITTDGFGFMLAYGDLAWVPIYSLQAHYLRYYDPKLSVPLFMGVVALNFLGYWIFRASNSEKNAFRCDPTSPSVKHLKYLETKSGSRLITSGWWGVSRHINYLGDWMMGLAWCMITGFSHPIPYFYAVYFGVLLIHRGIRDEHKCASKYGEDWVKYCKQVPYRIIPYVY